MSVSDSAGPQLNLSFDQRAKRAAIRAELESALRLGPGRKVLIFGGYGTSNVGDDAILAGLLSALPNGVEASVVSMRPQETERLHRVRAVAPVRVPFELLSTNAVIIGGGGIFSGHMGRMSKLLPAMSLSAGLLRKRVAYYGVGVYPGMPGWVRKLLRRALAKADLTTVRDRPSLEILKSWNLPAKLVPDLALLLDPNSDSGETGAPEILTRRSDRPLVGLCLTAVGDETGDRMLRTFAEVIDRMRGVDFVFVPMSQHPVINSHNDLLMARTLKNLSARLQILEGYYHPAQVLRYFGTLDAAVCMRFHSMVLAELAATPVVPISYADKTRSWLDERHLRSVEIDPDALVSAIKSAIDQRESSEAA